MDPQNRNKLQNLILGPKNIEQGRAALYAAMVLLAILLVGLVCRHLYKPSVVMSSTPPVNP
jgi:hypothetical protein